jgi:HAD superfamily hydrolase (TIGR01509 family)
MRFADLDAVTVDGFGTLLELEDPTEPLARALAERGVDRSSSDVGHAFAVEARHYRLHAHTAGDDEALRELRRDCARVFLDDLAAPLEPEEFVDAFLAALVFRPVAGAVEAIAALRSHGLRLAVVSNWDCALPERLDALGLLREFDTVVTSAEVGVPKPEPDALRVALERLGAPAGRALHVGDEGADAQAARAAGMHFAPAPLSTAVAALS